MKRWVTAIASAAALSAAAPSALAAPGDYQLTYDWQGSPETGYAGVSVTPIPPDDTPGFESPYYRVQLGGPMPGIRLEPTPAADGTRNRTYPETTAGGGQSGVRIITQVDAPGTTRVRSADFERITYRRASGERQFLRFAIYGGVPSVFDTAPTAGPPGPFVNDQTYAVPRVTVTDPSGQGRSVQTWMFTSCDPSCPTVAFDGPEATPRSYGSEGRLVVRLRDPEPPTVSLTGPAADGAWTNSRETRALRIVATDPGSGTRSGRLLRRRAGAGTTVAASHTASCDATHRTSVDPARPAAACPAFDPWTVPIALGSLASGIYTFTAESTDDSARVGSASATVRIDRRAPAAAAPQGPGARRLGSKWTRDDSPTAFAVRATDDASGVQSAELVSRAGAQESSLGRLSGLCGPVDCGRRLSADIGAALTQAPDGEQTVLLRVTDRAGNATLRRVGLLRLDRRAPSSPRLTVVARGRRAHARWTAARDPAPGSGLAAYLVRSRVNGGAWSRPRQTSSRQQSRVPVKRGDRVAFEVVAVDRAGNRSAASSASATVGGRPARSPRTRCRTLLRCHGSVVLYARERKKKNRRCPIFVFPSSALAPGQIAPDPRNFVARNLRPGFSFKLGYSNKPEGADKPIGQSCGKPTVDGPPDFILEATARMRLHVNDARGEVIDQQISLRYTAAGAGDPLRTSDFACRPSTDGNTRPDRFGNGLRRVTLALVDLQGVTVLTGASKERVRLLLPGTRTFSFLVRCPSTPKRHDNELAAWKDLWGFNPRTGHFTSADDTKKASRSFLRATLKSRNALPKSGPARAWEAHHIVPIADRPGDGAGLSAYRTVVPGAFRCHLYPNELANGVFLRQQLWQRGTGNYLRLSARAKRRQWHPLSTGRFSGQYFVRLRSAFTDAIESNGECRSRSRFDGDLRSIKRELKRGTFVPKRLEPRAR